MIKLKSALKVYVQIITQFTWMMLSDWIHVSADDVLNDDPDRQESVVSVSQSL